MKEKSGKEKPDYYHFSFAEPKEEIGPPCRTRRGKF